MSRARIRYVCTVEDGVGLPDGPPRQEGKMAFEPDYRTHEDGFSEGYAAGKREAQVEIENLKKEIKKLKKKLKEKK